MRKLLSFLMAGVLFLTAVGCAAVMKTQGKETAYDLYFMEADLEAAAGKSALHAEQILLPEDDVEKLGTQKMAEYLVQKLLEGPKNQGLRNTIPEGTRLLSLKMMGTRAVVDLSAEYERLSGVLLTMADYALTLTLTQLPQIMSVKVSVQGRDLTYRDSQVFTEQDVLLAPEGDILGTVAARLYFPNEATELQPESRVLELYEGDTQIAAVIRALEKGPEEKGLFPIFSGNFRMGKVWLEDTVCYVNLSAVLLETVEDPAWLSLVLESIGSSICSLDAVEEVRYLVDGTEARWYGPVNISEPYTEP